MRNGQNKRMRGRNQHHRKNQNPLTRVYESNGPDVKIRGTASHVTEKYMQLARDATSSGDPVTAENYYQHAEHYLRLIAAAQEQFRQQNPYYRPEGEMRDDNTGEDSFDDGDDTAQPMQGQQNFGNNQQPYPPRDAQQPYPPRELQPHGGQQQPNHQGRPQHQPHQHHPQHQHHQPHQQQPHQQHQQPQHQQPQIPSAGNEGSDVERLPSFITGGQPQQNFSQNGYDSNQGGDRYGRHRRRRHRGPHRSDMQGGQGTGGGDAPDNQRPEND